MMMYSELCNVNLWISPSIDIVHLSKIASGPQIGKRQLLLGFGGKHGRFRCPTLSRAVWLCVT